MKIKSPRFDGGSACYSFLENMRAFGVTINDNLDRKNARHVALANLVNSQMDSASAMLLLTINGHLGIAIGLLRKMMEVYHDCVVLRHYAGRDQFDLAARFLDWFEYQRQRNGRQAGIVTDDQLRASRMEFIADHGFDPDRSKKWTSGLPRISNARDKSAWVSSLRGNPSTINVVPDDERFLEQVYEDVFSHGSYYIHPADQHTPGTIIEPWRPGDILAECRSFQNDGYLGYAALFACLSSFALVEELSLWSEFELFLNGQNFSADSRPT